MAKFRFRDLRVWQESMEIAMELLDIADDLGQRHLYRFAEQLRGGCHVDAEQHRGGFRLDVNP